MPILWTKFLIGGPWRAGRRAVAKALSATLERGGWAYVDLYQASSCPLLGCVACFRVHSRGGGRGIELVHRSNLVRWF